MDKKVLGAWYTDGMDCVDGKCADGHGGDCRLPELTGLQTSGFRIEAGGGSGGVRVLGAGPLVPSAHRFENRFYPVGYGLLSTPFHDGRLRVIYELLT